MARIKGKTDKARRSMMLPTKIVPVGDVIVVGGVRMRAVIRPRVAVPSMVCSGCAMRSRFCDNFACSRSDRDDGMNVWFVEDGGNESPVILRIGSDADRTVNLDMSDDSDAVADALVSVAADNGRFRGILLDVVEDILLSMDPADAEEWIGSVAEDILD